VFRKLKVDDEVRELPEWEGGKVSKLYARFDVNPRGLRWRSRFDIRFELANEAFGGDHEFTQITGEGMFRLGSERGSNLALRVFGGFTLGEGRPPMQELFYADGANPVERFDKYYLRSTAAFPAELHYHLPGNGNLRGYFDQHDTFFLAGKNLMAANIEGTVRWDVPFLRHIFSLLNMQTAFSAFFDAGRIDEMMDGDSKTLMDAGVGVRLLGRLPYYRRYVLRFDFPIWLSDPQRDEDDLKFRWLFSFSQAL
jgi:hypothetical protein